MPHTATDSKLSAKQISVIDSLIAGSSVTDAAKATGIDRSTVHRWFKSDAQFVAEHNQIRVELVQAQREKLRSLSDKALETVETLLDDSQASGSLRLRAALAILDRQGLKASAIGRTDPVDIENAWRQAERFRRAGI
jgi:hypothetical protein